jgi:hypothetical protein
MIFELMKFSKTNANHLQARAALPPDVRKAFGFPANPILT